MAEPTWKLRAFAFCFHPCGGHICKQFCDAHLGESEGKFARERGRKILSSLLVWSSIGISKELRERSKKTTCLLLLLLLLCVRPFPLQLSSCWTPELCKTFAKCPSLNLHFLLYAQLHCNEEAALGPAVECL